MPLVISDDILKQTGLSEREMAIEIACRLFAARAIEKPDATRLCGLSRVEFEDELIKRGLPILFLDEEYWAQELDSMKKLGWLKCSS